MSPLPQGITDLLLDIEGTTTPVTFVTSVLFPYARTRLQRYLSQPATPALFTIIDGLQREQADAARSGQDPPAWRATTGDAVVASAVSLAAWLMDRDSKATPLKELQGHIWEAGYRSGELTGEVFADVAPALRDWQRAGRRTSIFSSGSVLGQQLLFRHSSAGDLTPLLHAYFDTRVGAKRDAASYTAIARSLDRPPGAILFLSDVPAELAAARQAGMEVRLVQRPGNAPVDDGGYVVVRGLGEIMGSGEFPVSDFGSLIR